jgi:hypothetical protein
MIGTTPNFDLFNIKNLPTQQTIITTTVMNVNPLMAVKPTNVLCI